VIPLWQSFNDTLQSDNALRSCTGRNEYKL
jgi:hypothetical protein